MGLPASRANRTLLIKLVVVAIGMFGFGFALVPFYYQICAVTGINNVVEQDAVGNTQVDRSRVITIEFDTNVRDHMPWRFIPEKNKMQIHPGELAQVMYKVENQSGRDMVGQAIPSYGPGRAGRYFKKLECFCFTQQRFRAGEVREMPVLFAIDKDLPQEITTITLSYSFFEVNGTDENKKG
jgi:cytochrome c oxidase assembly protein subunit 11